MRDGQGCLLPVLRCHHQKLLLEEGPLVAVPWLIPQILRADVVSQLPEVLSSTPALVEDSASSKMKKRKKQSKLRGNFKVRVSSDNTNDAAYAHHCNGFTPEGQPSFLCQGYEIPAYTRMLERGVHNGAVATRSAKKTACSPGANGGNSDAQDDHASYLPGLDDETALRCLAFASLADHHKLALVAQRYRRLVRSSLLFELRRAYKIVEQWVCIYTSGDGGWTAFDPKQNVWRNLPPANVDPIFDLSDRESLSAGTHLLWLGREVFDFACYKYDLITNTWERGPPMVNSRCLFASASCGEFAFVAGGFSVGLGMRVLNSAERYDARVGKWEPLTPMVTPRQKCSGVFMDGKFYVIGGKDSDHNPLTSGEVYDPVSKTWTTIPDMVIPPEASPSFEPSPPLVAVADNQLYAIESSTNLLKWYNKSKNTWKVLGLVPVRADECNGWGLAFKALGDELFVIGGYRANGYSREGVAVFSWRPQFDMAVPEWQPDTPPLEWKLVNRRLRGIGNFLYNCAVMAC